MADPHPGIADLVTLLPEVYQPIHGHPELSTSVSRTCDDRWVQIAHIHDTLQAQLGRPLRVLDLGCAQGYFSLRLAERGAQVEGLDYLDANIAVCQALAAECSHLQVAFRQGRIEEVLPLLRTDQYDLVLGLSVFHHLIDAHGVACVRALLDTLAERVAAMLIEVALPSEPLYWAAAQPTHPHELLAGFAFVHELARHPTHLSAVQRPLYIASNRYWLLGDQSGPIDTHRTDPHALAQGIYQGSRHYFGSGNRLIKLFRLDHPQGDRNRTEIEAEARFLANPPAGFHAPACHFSGANQADAWLVRECLPGRLLLDHLRAGTAIDHRLIVRTILQQLIALEAAGLHHGDLRTWNILIGDNGQPILLDYGSISAHAQDVAWPGNLYLSFFVFVNELVTGNTDAPEPLRPIALGPWSLPAPYRSWARALWVLPPAQWCFQRFLDQLEQAEAATEAKAEVDSEPFTPEQLWAQEIEHALERQSRFMKNLHWAQTQQAQRQDLEQAHARLQDWSHTLEQTLAEKNRHLEELEFMVRHLEAESEGRRLQIQTELDTARANMQTAQAQAEAAQAQLLALHSSLSWRITAPARALPRYLRTVTTVLGQRARGVGATIACALSPALLRHAPRLHATLSKLLPAATAATVATADIPVAGMPADPANKPANHPADPADLARVREALQAAVRQPD